MNHSEPNLQCTTGIKECLPIKNLEELLSWSPDQCPNITKLVSDLENHVFFDGPKVIVCHDMKGGYLEDRFIDGDDNHEAYRFFHWNLVDTFIYFSHYFISIPPITWINAAHVNGVPVLGTIITEGSIGRELCEKLLKSDDIINSVCEKLIALAKHYKIEGWFINIENEIEESLIPKLIHFIKTLRRLIKQSINQAQVLWYDSVTIEGSLKWQNCLNNRNVDFFQSCDGIFLNYTWKDDDLKNSRDLALSLGRLNDVYVGVDVFGRGMFGDGGFKTNLAIDKIRENLLSIAIFAPGWVLEILGPNDFTNNQIKFWRELQLEIRHSPKVLPFSTNFCQGFGLSKFVNGCKVQDKSWFNLSLSNTTTRNYVEDEIFLQDAFDGGHSIRMVDWNEPILSCYFNLDFGLVIDLIYKVTGSSKALMTPKIKVQCRNSEANKTSLER
ncbi:cytosolic endo-beta-N-acetylglucosaminidase-like isoform X2 [Tetranychus urticae]|uniref:Cytosolic endo-beta-N-acetylglucosaminidase n=2 Tax=Tetranychus urticae TaxID=32264 RepID=T1K967_TETUR|nr:cytosolic endo-beta-N-acetylglucosaminidase-like isoform X2 [Tetranychus urticae]